MLYNKKTALAFFFWGCNQSNPSSLIMCEFKTKFLLNKFFANKK